MSQAFPPLFVRDVDVVGGLRREVDVSLPKELCANLALAAADTWAKQHVTHFTRAPDDFGVNVAKVAAKTYAEAVAAVCRVSIDSTHG